MAKPKTEQPAKEPEAPQPVPTPDGPSIDDRMAALRDDHIAMGARDKDDHWKPRE